MVDLGAHTIETAHVKPEKPVFTLRKAHSKADIEAFANISCQYHMFITSVLGEFPVHQNFEAEVASLPGLYAEPCGVILIVSAQCGTAKAQDVGAVALRPFSQREVHDTTVAVVDWTIRTCEMKRLYVLPAWHKYGLGRKLVEAAVSIAQQLGYRRVFLDTVTQLESANRLYSKAGFKLCPSYNGNPMPDVCFWEKSLPVVNNDDDKIRLLDT